MHDKPLTSFRPIAAPLDVDDAALNRLNDTFGVPTLTKPAAEAAPAPQARQAVPAQTEDVPAAAPLEKLTIEVPDYLADAIRRTALDRKSSARHVVMKALQRDGFDIAFVDLVPDGRHSRKRNR